MAIEARQPTLYLTWDDETEMLSLAPQGCWMEEQYLPRYWLGADLVVAVVSPDAPERDTITKRADYAGAGIAEYWVVNLAEEPTTVLTLAEGTYVEYGVLGRGEPVTSALLPELRVRVDAAFNAA